MVIGMLDGFMPVEGEGVPVEGRRFAQIVEELKRVEELGKV